MAVLVATSIGVIVFPELSTTYTVLPSGVTAIEDGPRPAWMGVPALRVLT